MKTFKILLLALALTWSVPALADDDDSAGDDATQVDDDDSAAAAVVLPVIIVDDEIVVADPAALLSALQGGNYTVLVGIALMLLLWGARKWAKLDDRIDKRIIPVVAVVIGIGAECLIALAVGGPVTQAVAEGLLVGLVASGSWTAAGKHLLPAPPKKEEPRDDA